MQSFTISGNIVDVLHEKMFYGTIHVQEGKIINIVYEAPVKNNSAFILPGFIDSHVHIESSMLVPSEFARLAVVHGTIGTISDPHEIANVCGVEGVHFMIDNGKEVNFKFHFGAPSCVPATIFETAGDAIDSTAVQTLLANDDIFYLSEMMNFPGVWMRDEEVMKKIAAAKQIGKPVDGHAPGVMGNQAKDYIQAGYDEITISTDHECFTKEEALDKLNAGMKIIIREGSAAKNFEALIDLLHQYADSIMFCSDDKHPDSLVLGHINHLCKRAVAKGVEIFKVLKAACINPVQHYKMKVGVLQVGDVADFIVVNDLQDFTVTKTYINGILVAEEGNSFIPSVPVQAINKFNVQPVSLADLQLAVTDYPQQENKIPVIEALDGQLITNKLWETPCIENGLLVSDAKNDVLKMVVVNRYNPAPVAKCFIKNFKLIKGALASSVAHDSHNIVAVGCDDESLLKAINWVIEARGGVAVAYDNIIEGVALPVAGLMSANDGYAVADAYTIVDKMSKDQMGSTLAAPFMTLSFMALLVIPYLKLSDKGLFDGSKFEFVK